MTARGAAVLLVVAAAGSALMLAWIGDAPDRPRAGRVPLAVIGDSDSHAFHDTLAVPPGGTARGGAMHAVTLQWTEALARLRGTEVDQGPWGVRGRAGRLARVAGWAGIHVRTPRKQDFAFNAAYAGARCGSLPGPLGQVTQVARLLRADSAAWSRGAVVIRIGINDLGGADALEAIAARGVDAAARDRVRACTDTILDAVTALRAAHPTVGIVLVGLADNAHWPPNFPRFRSADALRHLRAYHDAYDDALRARAARGDRVLFFDDRAFFESRWGGRDAGGAPAYRALALGGLVVTHRQGDDLGSTVLADGHAGTVLNALWAQQLTRLLHDALGLGVTPVTDAEVAALVDTLVATLVATPARPSPAP